MIYIGIDPGVDGGIAFLDHDGWLIEVLDMPTMKRGSTGNKRQVNQYALADMLRTYRDQEDGKIVATLELVGSMPGQGVTSMFNFGDGFGVIKGVLAGLDISVTFVPPQKWKKYFFLTGKDKDCARTLAQERYPAAPLKLKKHIGRADALLIGAYGFNHHK